MGAAKKIKRLEKGSTDTLLTTERANEIIDAVNALLALKFAPDGIAKVLVADANVLVTLNLPKIPGAGSEEALDLTLVNDGGVLATYRFPGATFVEFP